MNRTNFPLGLLGAQRLTVKKNPHCCGFTLVEMLIVVLIISLIVSIAVPAVGNAIQKTREVQLQGTLKFLNEATKRARLKDQWANPAVTPGMFDSSWSTNGVGLATKKAAIKWLIDNGYELRGEFPDAILGDLQLNASDNRLGPGYWSYKPGP